MVQFKEIKYPFGNKAFCKAQGHILFRIHHLGSDLFKYFSLFRAIGLGHHLGDPQIDHIQGRKDAHIHLIPDTDHHHVTVLDPGFPEGLLLQILYHISMLGKIADLPDLFLIAVQNHDLLSGFRQRRRQGASKAA